MTTHSPSPNILLHPQYNQQIPLLQYHHHPLSLSNNASKAAVHSLYISIPCRQTADVWRFEAKGGWFRVGKFDFAKKFLLGDIVIVSGGIEMSFPCFTLYSVVETQFHKVRQWTIMLLRPIMKQALFFFSSTPPSDMNGFGNGTMQYGCTVHTHTIYIIQCMGKLIAKWR